MSHGPTKPLPLPYDLVQRDWRLQQMIEAAQREECRANAAEHRATPQRDLDEIAERLTREWSAK